MANVCEQCGKRPQVGHRVSHSNIKTLHVFSPNMVRRSIVDPATGKKIKVKVCTACLRSMVKVPR